MKLFKPDIEVNPDSNQQELCGQQMRSRNITGATGGCFGIKCSACILEQDHFQAFITWIHTNNPHTTGQKELFE